MGSAFFFIADAVPMLAVVQQIAVAAVMFAATNADDLVLLGIFFARPDCRTRTIVLGQLAGIGSLTAISYTISALTLAVPHQWLPWLGVIPLVIGLRWLYRDKDDTAAPTIAVTWWSIAGITLANGADNLGVYIPSFAMQTGPEKVITGATFFVLTLLWCVIARMAVLKVHRGSKISALLARAAPFVLISLGLWIIAHHPVFGVPWFKNVVE